MILENKSFYIYPYNDIGLKLKDYLDCNNINYDLISYLDNHKTLSLDLGYKVSKVDTLNPNDFDYVIIVSLTYSKIMKNDLIEKGVPNSKIIYAAEFFNNFLFFNNEKRFLFYGIRKSKFCNFKNNILEKIRKNKKLNLLINRNDKMIFRLKEKYNYERCFIIGTGPSLRISDLERLNNEYTFGSNGLFLGLNNTNFRPSFYSICDKKSMHYFRNNVVSFFDRNTTLLFPKPVLEGSSKIKNAIYYDAVFDNKTNFDLTEGIYTGATVTYNLISLAIYMGFKNIYLLGTDFNYSFLDNKGTNHFIKDYPEDKNKDSAEVEIMLWIRDFEKLKERIKGKNINIYNATRGGKLEVFERVDFDEIIKGGRNK